MKPSVLLASICIACIALGGCSFNPDDWLGDDAISLFSETPDRYPKLSEVSPFVRKTTKEKDIRALAESLHEKSEIDAEMREKTP